MMSRPLIIRADASTRVGTGHVMRCLSLAQGWRRACGEAIFVCAEITPALETRLNSEGFTVLRLSATPGSLEDARQTIHLAKAEGGNLKPETQQQSETQVSGFSHQPSWVVCDGYHFDVDYQRAIKVAGLRLLLLDDYGHATHYCADFVLNQNLSARAEFYKDRDPSTRLLLGTKYVQLRHEFLAYRDWQRDIPTVSRKVLVTLGGADPDNVTGKVIDALRDLDVEAKIVVGGSNPHLEQLKAHVFSLHTDVCNMPKLMAWADVAIAAGGTTSWELAFMGLPALVLVLADNQRDIARSLQDSQIAQITTPEQIVADLCALQMDMERRRAMSRRGRHLIDGLGTQRVVQQLELRELPALTSRPPTPTATSSTEVPAAAKALQIAVVVDNPRSWFIPHAHNLVNHFREFGQAMFLSAATEIPAGTDFAFLLSCEKIVPPSILGRSRHNIVVHASDLPRGKGMSPLTWQVLEGKNIIPVTLFEAVADVDAGTIYLTDSVIFQGHELLPEMHAALGKKICQMCLRFLHEYPQAIKAGQEQTGTPTIYPRRHPEDSRLDPSKSIAEQFNLLRIVDNDRYPAFFEWQGKKYILRINQDRETKL